MIPDNFPLEEAFESSSGKLFAQPLGVTAPASWVSLWPSDLGTGCILNLAGLAKLFILQERALFMYYPTWQRIVISLRIVLHGLCFHSRFPML